MKDENKKKSLRMKILEAEDIQSQELYIPEWDATVEVRSLSGAERNRAIELAKQKAKKGGVPTIDLGRMYVEMIRFGCYDPETGERLFDEADVGALGRKSTKALDRITGVIKELSGIGDDAEEELEGNSAATPDEESILN